MVQNIKSNIINVCWANPSGEKLGTLGVRDPRCNPKRSVAQNKTHGYHIDFELCDRSCD